MRSVTPRYRHQTWRGGTAGAGGRTRNAKRAPKPPIRVNTGGPDPGKEAQSPLPSRVGDIPKTPSPRQKDPDEPKYLAPKGRQLRPRPRVPVQRKGLPRPDCFKKSSLIPQKGLKLGRGKRKVPTGAPSQTGSVASLRGDGGSGLSQPGPLSPTPLTPQSPDLRFPRGR